MLTLGSTADRREMAWVGDFLGSASARDCGTSRSLVVAIRLSVYVLPLLEDVASLIVARGLGIDKGWVS